MQGMGRSSRHSCASNCAESDLLRPPLEPLVSHTDESSAVMHLAADHEDRRSAALALRFEDLWLSKLKL